MCVQKIGDENPTLANVCCARARSCRMHVGKCKRVLCKSELYTAQHKATHTCAAALRDKMDGGEVLSKMESGEGNMHFANSMNENMRQ